MAIKEINSKELKEKLDNKESFVLIDVRELDEWDAGHIEQAGFIPLSSFENDFEKTLTDKNQELVIQCKSGGRSMKACMFLEAQGFTNLTNLSDGILGWNAEGYPTKIGPIMLDLFGTQNEHRPLISEKELSDEDVLIELTQLKEELKDEVIVLGHHYQQDDVIKFADVRGDSLALAQKGTKLKQPYIVFCGVHFMAETADMLSTDEQTVILPDLRAGCSMADMANRTEIDTAWSFLTNATKEKIVPVTYINCSADLKSFVGENNGSICTSSNAKKVITWALDQGEKLMFFPDQHLGRNTCHELGISVDDMVVYDPKLKDGGLTTKQVEDAKVILWYGYCSVHQGFKPEHINNLRENRPDVKIIVHPECSFDVVQKSDMNGSTAYIIDEIRKAPAGSKFAVGTEINLVNRLANEMPDKEIFSLSPYQCLCATMYRVRPRWMLATFRAIKNKDPINVIKVDAKTTKYALKALNTMLEIS